MPSDAPCVPPLLRRTRTRPGLHALPARRDAHAGRLRLGQPRRRADARRRGARLPRGQGGLPFAGQAGELLERLLAGIGLDARDVYLANVLKCRPPQNRDPLEAEIAACEPHLFRQIELVRPRVVATLGNFATKLLSGRPLGITRVHGQEQEVTLGGTACIALPALPPGRRALHAVDAARCSRTTSRASPALLGRATVPPAPHAVRSAAEEPGRPTRGSRRLRVERASAARCSSASSERAIEVDHGSAAETEALGGPARRASCAPATSSSSAASSAPARRRSSAGPCRALGVDGAGHEPDVHDRPPLRGDGRRSRTSTSTASSGVCAAEWGDLEPYFDDTIVFVEWPEAGARASCPRPRARSSLEHVAPDERRDLALDSADGTLLEGLAAC